MVSFAAKKTAGRYITGLLSLYNLLLKKQKLYVIISFVTKTAGYAGVAELADALDLGSSGNYRGGSSPFSRTKFK